MKEIKDVMLFWMVACSDVKTLLFLANLLEMPHQVNGHDAQKMANYSLSVHSFSKYYVKLRTCSYGNLDNGTEETSEIHRAEPFSAEFSQLLA